MRKLALFLLVGASFVYGCGGSTPSPVSPAPAASEAPAAQAKANVKAPGEAAIGDTTTCPVSGEEFVVTGGSPVAEYQGKTYYFCCAGCAKKFEAEPTKFVHGS